MGFTNEPKTSQMGAPFQIVRVAPGKPITGVVLSRRHVGAELHYWKRRTRLCTGSTCEPCQEGYAPRWYGYFYILRSGIGTVQILEFTARCFPSIEEYYSTIGEARGARFNASRLRKETNSPMALTLSEERISTSALSDPPPLAEILCRIWEVPSAYWPSGNKELEEAAVKQLLPGFEERRKELLDAKARNGDR